jgi:hypothetical protein
MASSAEGFGSSVVCGGPPSGGIPTTGGGPFGGGPPGGGNGSARSGRQSDDDLDDHVSYTYIRPTNKPFPYYLEDCNTEEDFRLGAQHVSDVWDSMKDGSYWNSDW